MIVYPHRISPFETRVCDVCTDKVSVHYMAIDSIPFKGLQCCDKSTCRETSMDWMVQSTIPLDKLSDIFGPKISIRRSDGARESGWTIQSPAYKEAENDEYWVKVMNDSMKASKYVTMKKLSEWNPTSAFHSIFST